MESRLFPKVSRIRIRSISLVLLFLMTAGTCAFAQIITSSITGFVTDPSGASVPGARVTLTEARTGFTRTVTTNDQGQYSAIGIPAGTYTVTVEKEGFKTAPKAGQVITQQLAARIDVVMEVGSIREAVTVKGEAPLLNSETPSNAVTLSEVEITRLPTLGGSYLSTAILSPGVIPTVGSSILSVVEGEGETGGASWKPVSVDASGGPPDLTGFVEDGFDLRDPTYGGDLYQPSVEAIQSVRIVRGFDTSQYGGEPSVAYLNTKSGTNQYHGSAFEYNEVGALAARPFGVTHSVPLTYNQAGWTFGGPLTPRLKDKTFVFAAFQLTRNRSGNPQLGIVPTAAEWGGDLSGVPSQIYNPFSVVGGQRAAFSGNQISPNLLSPVA